MPTPDPRTPICIARGQLADLQKSIADLDEGEICYAFDEKATYVKHDDTLQRVNYVDFETLPGVPSAEEYDIMQASGGKWIGKNAINGGNF